MVSVRRKTALHTPQGSLASCALLHLHCGAAPSTPATCPNCGDTDAAAPLGALPAAGAEGQGHCRGQQLPDSQLNCCEEAEKLPF